MAYYFMTFYQIGWFSSITEPCRFLFEAAVSNQEMVYVTYLKILESLAGNFSTQYVHDNQIKKGLSLFFFLSLAHTTTYCKIAI